MFIKEKTTPGKDKLGRQKRPKTIGIFQCDLKNCKKLFKISHCLKARKQNEFHFCSSKCLSSAKKKEGIVRKKTDKTNKKEYGVKSMLEIPEIRNKIAIESGVENISQLEETKEKKKETSIKNWDVDNPMKSETVKKTYRENYKEKHGVDNPAKNPDVAKKMSNSMKNGGRQKAHETKKKNGTYKKSKGEDMLYDLLCEKFNEKNVERQVPVLNNVIDFLLKFNEKNIYIEFNGEYWHGTLKNIKELEKDALNGGKQAKKIVNHYYRDLKLIEYFEENGLKFIQITDTEFKKAQKTGYFKNIIDKIVN